MKKSALLALALVGASTTAQADDLTISTTFAYESRYIFRGVQFAETSIQPGVELGYGNFYGGVWFNLPIGDDDFAVTPGGEELDVYGGYTTSLTDFFSLDVGFTYYTFPDLARDFFDTFDEDGDGLGANTFELFAGLSLDAPLSPSVYFYRDFNLDTFTIEGGASHSIPLAEKTSFDLGATLAYVIDDNDGGDYLYGVATADFTYALTDAASASVGVRYGGTDIEGGAFLDDTALGTTDSSGFWWGVSLSSSF